MIDEGMIDSIKRKVKTLKGKKSEHKYPEGRKYKDPGHEAARRVRNREREKYVSPFGMEEAKTFDQFLKLTPVEEALKSEKELDDKVKKRRAKDLIKTGKSLNSKDLKDADEDGDGIVRVIDAGFEPELPLTEKFTKQAKDKKKLGQDHSVSGRRRDHSHDVDSALTDHVPRKGKGRVRPASKKEMRVSAMRDAGLKTEAKVDAGLDDEGKEDARNYRKFGTKHNQHKTAVFRRELHRSRRGEKKVKGSKVAESFMQVLEAKKKAGPAEKIMGAGGDIAGTLAGGAAGAALAGALDGPLPFADIAGGIAGAVIGSRAGKTAGKAVDNISNAAIRKKKIKEDVLSEVAPPTKKHERMVKHIKKSYAKKGGLSDEEKSIAYATAWKNYKKDK